MTLGYPHSRQLEKDRELPTLLSSTEEGRDHVDDKETEQILIEKTIIEETIFVLDMIKRLLSIGYLIERVLL
ncbi:MAG: hypothetical protein GY820_45475 [Gammaproteobacteria bacterium]|nr:hypothetical protein [Gammaproteobacteria bacterium]